MAEHGDRIGRVTAHIAANLAGDLSLDALAEVAALSRFHFHRIWKAATGETVAETVRRERLNRAAVLVAMTTQPIAAVARRTGFADADALGRAFRAAWTFTPREARARTLVPPALAPPGPATPNPGDRPMTDVTIRDAVATEIAALPHRGPYTAIGPSFDELARRLTSGGVAATGPAYAIYYDMPGITPDDQLRAHAGVEIRPGGALPEGLDRVAVGGGRVAVLTHRGPYSGIAGAWDAAYRWLGSSAEDASDAPPYERYLNDMETTAPEDLLTEICIPLKG